ncbi:hypothetical protein COY95_02040 [Candidatus Woesearchaeota archaeon CG_4_10_14_0_8_um_filter_47_5]|nr:MAG: hypothetical protein COY95_02040 [Candidatus Woesearchaeota archaeon CG_4_10_14_0_8_um_filter_47_5]
MKGNTAQHIILVTHGPPYNTAADRLDGQLRGNRSFLRFIKKHQPLLAVCGHLHENAKKMDYVGNTLVVNPGSPGMVFEF